MKNVYVMITFHAHEPYWDLPKMLLEKTRDSELQQMFTPRNYLRERAGEGRDIYSQCIEFAKTLGIPVGLEATNELLVQISQEMPETFARMKDAYSAGNFYPILGHAHHTHMALLDWEELKQEIEWNRELLQEYFKIKTPKYWGYFPTECSVDSRFLQAIKQSGVDYILFPHLSDRKARFRVQGTGDTGHMPFYIAKDKLKLLALPRDFNVSQNIWRPLTKLRVEKVEWQGYCLGRYYVFDEEYNSKKFVKFPVTFEEAVLEYSRAIEKSIAETPGGGLVLYIQDLELMDLGDDALNIARESWKRVLRNADTNIIFTSPDRYLDHFHSVFREEDLPVVEFDKISWAPEIRVVLRMDGHYPPLYAKKYKGVDPATIFRENPFIFWEPGNLLIDVFKKLLNAFEISTCPGITAVDLVEKRYDIRSFDVKTRVALHHRIQKRACNWGWRPEEDRQKRAYLHGLFIVEDLIEITRENAESAMRAVDKFEGLSERNIHGLRVLLKLQLDTRIEYLKAGLEKLEERNIKRDMKQAFKELEGAGRLRWASEDSIDSLTAANQNYRSNRTDKQLVKVLAALQAHCRLFLLSTNQLQKVWSSAGDPKALVLEMYQHLYGIFPPLYPQLKKEVEQIEG